MVRRLTWMVVIGAALLAALPSAAGAGGTFATWGGRSTDAVTWIDAAGRLRGAWIEDRFEFPTRYDLVIARHTTSEQPDASWGTDPETGEVGVRRIGLTPPLDAGAFPVLAASSSGDLTLSWSGSVICGDAWCGRLWFDRFTADGSSGGARIAVASSATPRFGLSDGSIVAANESGAVSWWSPTGALLASVDLGSPVAAAGLDGSGRLLALGSAGGLRRVAAGGSIDLSVSVPCPGGVDGPKTVAGGADGAIAVACGTGETSDPHLVVHRLTASGIAAWSTEVRGTGRPAVPQAVAIDSTGRTWVGADRCVAVGGGLWFCSVFDQVVLPVDAGGAGAPVGYQHERVAQIRSIGSGRVAVALAGRASSFTVDAVTFDTLPLAVPAPTCTPTAPTATAAAANSVTIGFTRCALTGAAATAPSAPSTYLVEAIGPSGAVASTATVPASSSSATVGGLQAGARYRFRVRAANASGVGPASTPTAWTTPPFRTFDRFVDRQYADLVGRPPTAAQRSQAVTALGNGTTTPVGFIDARLSEPWSGPRIESVSRLYRAYFLRDPDSGGLAFWVGRSRTGTSLQRISSAFAASSEFRSRYGALSNRGFVERVYANVLGRSGDPAGIAFWTGQLDQRRRDRGEVMVGFSESNEYQRTSAPRTEVTAVHFGLLGRAANAAEMATWAPVLAAGGDRALVIAAVLGTSAYADRVR